MYPQIIEEYSYRIVAMGHTYQYSGRERDDMVYSNVRPVIKYLTNCFHNQMEIQGFLR